MGRSRRVAVLAALAAAGIGLAVPSAPAGATPPPGAPAASPAEHWTAARRAAATPRDLVVDARGLGYLRRADGSLEPYGHSQGQLYVSPTPAARPVPAAKPGGGGGGSDTAPPSMSGFSPTGGATVAGPSVTFSLQVTDPSGVRSVTVNVTSPSGGVQSFAATATAGAPNTWTATVSGFTSGAWSWTATARDASRGAGNTTTSARQSFTVGTSGGGGTSTVANSPYTGGGPVQQAAGRIYFQMPTNAAKTSWAGYVCSGTVARDATSGRSVIITAAHCVYDDADKAFARNVLFIPNQSASGTRTDTDCSNDWSGCWAPAVGVVDSDWANRTFPDNIPWDYAFYVVNDADAHRGAGGGSDLVLDVTAGDMAVSFTAPTTGVHTHALGYSYSDDPNFMYCAQGLGTNGTANWFLSSCGLSGGASGGPWVQPLTSGDGPIVSVNSWGYSNGSPGMAGPKLSGTSAACLFDVARTTGLVGVANGVTPAGC